MRLFPWRQQNATPGAEDSKDGAGFLALPNILTRLAMLFIACGGSARAAEKVSVAAAANLVYALEAITIEFRSAAPDVAVTMTTGASGSLFAQIKNGAPFDVFLSADIDYPRQIAAAGLGDPATLRTFATGRLVLWTTRASLVVSDIAAVLRNADVRKVAIAQPKTAPYGRAAQATLAQLGVWSEAQGKIVIGENISQTAQFVETGNADAGFVALSLVLSPQLRNTGRWLEVPPALYARVPLDHAALLTTRGAANPAARRFLDFLGSEAARKILRQFGYAVP
jgi:molybdate transport system substrate-binding protein